ncbi:CapA family protein [Polyangium aurulentum]|uniref:CapA family protein n=1 Tax=Polyangium aurulentum TaxID=2567896 RepID=UPI0010AE05E4|nr:CapA family protein [Polyangium aurulentum]UQA57853.1 CapA family protein [Polyangium aurulentum]
MKIRSPRLPEPIRLSLLTLAIATGCDAPQRPAEAVTMPRPAPPQAAPAAAKAAAPKADRLTLVAGGDVSFGRLVGQILLREPERALFAPMEALLRSADVRFVNLECPISDQGKETVSPENNLVFNGPPASANALVRAGITVVSTANNHAWDYGKPAMLETLTHLDRAGVLHAGTGGTIEEARRPAIVDHEGFRLAILAVTDVWNQGALSKHPGREFVASADSSELTGAVRALRAEGKVDAIVVSYHGGEEYRDDPLPTTRALAEAVIDAGADAFLGHHPHVAQGIAFRAGKPIVYSMGNLLMRMHSGHPETEMGLVVRLELLRGGDKPKLWACPVRIQGIEPIPLGADPRRSANEGRFFGRLTALSRRVGDATFGAVGADGCAPVTPPG